MPETTVTTSEPSLLERAIAEANASDERDRQYRAEQAAQHRQWEIEYAEDTARRIFGEAAEGAAYEYLDAQEPYEADRVIVAIEGQRFEYDGQVNPPALRHLVPCPSLLHPKGEMRSDAITSLYDLGEIGRHPEGRYHCGECSRIEQEIEVRPNVEEATAKGSAPRSLPDREVVFWASIDAAKAAAELRESLETRERPAEQEIALAARVQAAAAEAQAWAAVVRVIDGDGV